MGGARVSSSPILFEPSRPLAGTMAAAGGDLGAGSGSLNSLSFSVLWHITAGSGRDRSYLQRSVRSWDGSIFGGGPPVLIGGLSLVH